ncbi:hypothetical protein GGX14DRAFT_388526 [Mycena pura]|uniref:Uncharacterized protein n=1 Tax=Mycena pura TaxID=153505 RepID=A0AAD6VS95_9AGAR|nr:hypothetical protein GGX14DRAFT_388526 [Mycena pura]
MLALLFFLFVPTILAHNVTLSRRFDGVRFSNYFAGQDEGACGEWHQDSEFVVALSAQNYNNGQYCNKKIYITYRDISAVATIVDECMGCPGWGLDFSQSLFGHFVGGEQNNLNVGIISGSWVFGTGPSNGDDDDSTKKTTTTAKHTTTSTSTTHTPTTTTTTTTSSTSSATSTHSSQASRSSAPSSKSASASTSPSASVSAPEASAPAAGPQNLYTFSNSLVNLLALVVQAPGAH